ncbi:hypothetical protein [Silvimonas sp.]|uniref:hypothetical protein n=1 Tax=Silvimonas sp. TaxID=2650811 RepID=UPI0028423011|nr:hypothetical protein [Silvimonas sp.]MDR3427972.1 hypothetical protein [Silvimonas sp.]
MTFRVERDESPRESFGHYKYRIFRDNVLVANYWHDYRGDEHGIDFVNGPSEIWPVGRMIEFLEGGGPHPTILSKRAEAYLKAKTV